MFKKFTQPGVVLGVIAIVLGVSGSAVAGGYIITSSKQIKPSVRRALQGDRGPRGFDGTPGPQGAQGFTGPQGPPGVSYVTTVDSQHIALAPGQSSSDVIASGTWRATCPPGSAVVGTGFDPGLADFGFVRSYGTFVGGFAYNLSSMTVYDIAMQAICAQGASPRTLTRSATSGEERYKADVARALAQHNSSAK